MNTKTIIKTMAKNQGVSLTELAGKIGITRQALYCRLDRQMKFDSFNELVEAMGGTLYVAFPGGNAKKLTFYDK